MSDYRVLADIIQPGALELLPDTRQRDEEQAQELMTHLVVFILQLCLCALTAASNRLCIISVECAAGLSVVQTGTFLIIASNQERHTKRPAHDAFLAISRLAKPQGQVANGLGAALNAQGLVVVEGVALTLDARVLHHATRIGLQTTHCAANVSVNLDNLLDRGGLKEGRRHSLLNA